MRGKRSKQYRKLMQQYGLTFGFREPYQVLVDAHMLQDTARFTMELVPALERTLHGKVKPMITQCSMRHLYALSSASLIATAKTFERRRCNHHTLDSPLSTQECFASVIDPKGLGTNKHRYVVASQEEGVRRWCRGVKGVPSVYVKRSVMVMEPMGRGSEMAKEGVEREKLREGIVVRGGRKRKQERDEEQGEGGEREVKKRKVRGLKGPNPLSVMKPKKRMGEGPVVRKLEGEGEGGGGEIVQAVTEGSTAGGEQTLLVKKKRKRKHKAGKSEDLEITAQDGGLST